MTGNEIRQTFLKFFEERGHTHRAQLLARPGERSHAAFHQRGDEPVQGRFSRRSNSAITSRATTCQKCVRAGGKHNDLENVGFTNRHHTFFEMLGNFSFGDYFKKDAIAFAWELVTSPQWFGIPVGKLYFTVFGGRGPAGATHDAAELLARTGAPTERVH